MGDTQELVVEVDPAEVGFDEQRLHRIDRHFQRYVDDGRLAGWLAVVTRNGSVAHVARAGLRDAEAGLPVTTDTVWRIYSMTKPITSVAAMMLWEQGAFELDDPVSRYLPAFADCRVYVRGSALRPATEPPLEPVRIWHLLSHTSGLSYGFHHAHPVDALYRARGFELSSPEGMDLAACVDAWASIPLMFQPGTEWNYGVSTDVVGRLVEVLSGQSLDAHLDEHVFGPLGMTETRFQVREADAGRLAALYVPNPADGRAVRNDAIGAGALRPPRFLSGGGGLVSTAADFHRFTQLLVRRGELDGVRLLGPRTLDHMTRNHLPGGQDLEQVGRPLFAETTFQGVGFGLGFSVLQDPVANRTLSSAGEYAWGGLASTAFWVDPAQRITAHFYTQLMPSSTHPIRSQLRQLVYQALVD